MSLAKDKLVTLAEFGLKNERSELESALVYDLETPVHDTTIRCFVLLTNMMFPWSYSVVSIAFGQAAAGVLSYMQLHVLRRPEVTTAVNVK